jgi:glyoxylase-like metal-dependent hydrolase (beta-lactamase superfamily II)
LSSNYFTKENITKPAENIICILAPNPSPMTFKGTNTYIIGNEELAIIDPGPINEEHLENILGILAGKPVKYIFLTHSHVDHSPLAKQLSAELKTPIYAYGTSDSGLSSTMISLLDSGYESGAEGIDYEFDPDCFIKDNQEFFLNDDIITAIHTPGHMGNHVCYQYGKVLFSGDHVMGWATSLVSPPYGDLTQFMTSCRLLQSMKFDLFLPGHGDPVKNPRERLGFLVNHRRERESQIKEAIKEIALTALEITEIIYTEIDCSLIPAATRNVFAHLIDLHERGLVEFQGVISEKSKAIVLSK